MATTSPLARGLQRDADLDRGSARQTPRVEGERTYRFTLGERIAHVNHALTFIILFLTGAALVFRGISGFVGRDGMVLFGQIHRVVAVLFTGLTIPVLLILSRKQSGEWIRTVFRFTRDDLKFLAGFPREFFGLKVTTPPQDKFNGGEKINSIFQILGWPVMVITGWLLVFKESLPQHVAQVTLAIHSFAAFFLGAVVIGHIYLAAVHPHSRPGISGMVSGWVPSTWARGHYQKWFDKLEKRSEK